jgi:endonuclease III
MHAKLGDSKRGKSRKALGELKRFWRKNELDGKTFVNFETALLRLGKDLCRKKKCGHCVVERYCQAIASG